MLNRVLTSRDMNSGQGPANVPVSHCQLQQSSFSHQPRCENAEPPHANQHDHGSLAPGADAGPGRSNGGRRRSNASSHPLIRQLGGALRSSTSLRVRFLLSPIKTIRTRRSLNSYSIRPSHPDSLLYTHFFRIHPHLYLILYINCQQ
jgi:hypothetical protein